MSAAAELIFAHLAAVDPLSVAPADAVIGFGTFDLGLARLCGALFTSGRAGRIVFTGGIGAGTADLGQPEADAWRQELRRTYPAIPDDRVQLENRSTNTAENIRFTAELLRQRHPQWTFGTGIRTAIGVAAPARLRRVALTWRKLQPAVTLLRHRPLDASYATEKALHAAKGLDFDAHLCGEVDRIAHYARLGWIVAEEVPAAVAAARRSLPFPALFSSP